VESSSEDLRATSSGSSGPTASGPTDDFYRLYSSGSDRYDDPSCKASNPLAADFHMEDVQHWRPDRFQLVGKIMDAPRNYGEVQQMYDQLEGRQVATKEMPNDWICDSHEDFLRKHPGSPEQPWTDVACVSFLNKTGYPWASHLVGVYRDAETTRVVTELATEGDLFSWCASLDLPNPGPKREVVVLPLAKQLCKAVATLHELSIVHRDLSMENILLSKDIPEGPPIIKVIDFGQATASRFFHSCNVGKPSYQAPEVRGKQLVDGFLSDAFAVGVTLYFMLMHDYPWLSTDPLVCKRFEYFSNRGFRAFIQKRKLQGSQTYVEQILSEEAIHLLEGLLHVDATKRMTLGEAAFSSSRHRSVWDEPWLQGEVSDEPWLGG